MIQDGKDSVITINKRHQCIGAEVLGVDLSAPMDGVIGLGEQEGQELLDELIEFAIAGDAPVLSA